MPAADALEEAEVAAALMLSRMAAGRALDRRLEQRAGDRGAGRDCGPSSPDAGAATHDRGTGAAHDALTSASRCDQTRRA